MNKNKVLSVFLTVCMLMSMLSVLPMYVRAEDASITLATSEPIYAGASALSFNVTGQASGSWVAIYHESQTLNGASYVDWLAVGSSSTVNFPSTTADRRKTAYWPFNGTIQAGKYTAVLFGDGTYSKPIANVTFEVQRNTGLTNATLRDKYVKIGDPVIIDYVNSHNAQDWIAVYKAGESGYLTWCYTPDANGTLRLTDEWTKTKGTYTIRYFENNAQSVKFAELTLNISPSAMHFEKTDFEVGEPITVEYEGSANANDWIAVYDSNGKRVQWLYTPDENGKVTFSGDWINTRGTYTAKYFESDKSDFCFDEETFTIGATTFSLNKTRYNYGEDIVVTYKNSVNKTDWIAVYNADGQYMKAYEYTPDERGTVTFKNSKHTWMNTPGEYTFKYLRSDSYTDLVDEKSFIIKEEYLGEYDAVYYTKAGGTGNGKTTETPAGSITDVLKQINADGWTDGDYVCVYVMRSDDDFALTVGTEIETDTINCVELYSNVNHSAKIKFTTYDYDDSLKNYAILSHYNQIQYRVNHSVVALGPEEFENIAIVDTRSDYRNDFYAQGWDMSFRNVVRYRFSGGEEPPYTLIRNNKTALQGGTNRKGTGSSGNGGRVTLTGSSLGNEFEFYFGGYTDNSGQVETFSDDVEFEANDLSIEKIVLADTNASRMMTYEKNVNVILNNATVGSFEGKQKAVVGGAIQILLNGNSSVASFTADAVAYNKEDKAEVPVYYMTVDSDGKLDVTETAGTYTVSDGKIAYAQTEDNRTIYYGSGTVTVPCGGRYTVHFADSLDDIKAKAKKPSSMGKHIVFDSWLEGESGVLTAQFKYVDEPESVASYYLKADGTGDGRTIENPAPNATVVTESINADGYTTGDLVTVYVIPSVEPAMKVGNTFTVDEYNFVEMNRSVGHTATIKYTTYQYDDTEKNYGVMAQAIQKGDSPININIFAQGPTIYEDIITLDTWLVTRTDLNAQGHDLTFKNSPRYRIGGRNEDGKYYIIKNAKTYLYHGVNRLGTGNYAQGGRITIYDGSEFSTIAYGGYTKEGGSQIEMYNGSMTTEINDTATSVVDLNCTDSSRSMTYKKNINLVLNGSTVNDFKASNSNTTIDGAIQILLNKGSSLNAFSANGVALSSDEKPVPVYRLTSTDAECSLDVTDEAGTYYVYGGKIAYTQSSDNRTIYYGSETLTVPDGTYTVSYAETVNDVMTNAVVPTREDAYHVFEKWEDNGDGTMTAVFRYQLPSYYVSNDNGSDENDGLTAETAFATTSKAIATLDGSRGVIYCVGDVLFEDAAHAETIVYDSFNGGTLHGANNKISLLGNAEFKVDFSTAQTITANGYDLTLSGNTDTAQENWVYAGANGKDQVVNVFGKYVHKLSTNAKGQQSGDTDICIDGGVVRLVTTGSGVANDTSYTVASVTVNVMSGELWYLNHTDDGPHRASGALQVVFNANTYKQFKSDITTAGVDGFPKIQFEKGKWIIRSADTSGNTLKYEKDGEGTYRVYGTKTPYYVSDTGLDVYYGINDKITLPTGTVDVLWVDEFKADDMPKPSLAQGFEFGGWEDDGNGHLTAIVVNPDYYYVDESGSDDNDGTQDKPFKTIAKALETFDGKNGTVYVVSNVTYDAAALPEYTGHVTIAPANTSAVLTGNSIELKGELTLKGFALAENTSFTTNGYRLELTDVNADGMNLDFTVNGADSKLVLPKISGAAVNITVSGSKARLVLNGTDVDKITATSDAEVKILGEECVIGAVDNQANAAFTILMNNGLQETVPGLSDSDTLILSDSKKGSIDYSVTDGTIVVDSSAGKLPVAVSDSGKAIAAASGYVEAEAPDTWYKSNDYANYINYRKPLSNTYKKLTDDKKLNVVYFGGSVTNGYGSSNAEKYSWRALTGQWLKDNFPNASVTNINRASGESGTYLGTYRLQRDVIAKNPDLLFLEYSINDKYYASSYEDAKLQVETIVREVREALPDCDIVMILVSDRNCIEENRQGKLHIQAQAHEDIAAAYNIPSIHVGRALVDSLPDDWGSVWSKYAIDGVHLTDAGNAVYFGVIREYMVNSLFCTEHSGKLIQRDALPAVVSAKLFDGNRTYMQPTNELIEKSKALGGSGFTFNSRFYGLYDYYGYATTSKSDSIFAFEFDGTDAAMHTNFYNESSIAVSVDGGDYVTKICAYHSPTKIVENLESGHHVVRIKPVYGSGSDAPKEMKIGVIFTRDSTKATVQGTQNAYDGRNTYSISGISSGVWHILYDAETVRDISHNMANEGDIFVGWNGAQSTDTITEGLVLNAKTVDINDYFNFAGVQIRLATENARQGLRFVVDKLSSLDSEVTIQNYGMVIIPSEKLGDTRSIADYNPDAENSTYNIVGADKLYVGSSHVLNGKTYYSADVVAEKIFASDEDSVRYTTCVTGIEEAGYDRYYTLKPYVRYTVDGVEEIAYGTAFRSSAYEVAKSILDDENASENAKNVAQSIVNAVENQ